MNMKHLGRKRLKHFPVSEARDDTSPMSIERAMAHAEVANTFIDLNALMLHINDLRAAIIKARSRLEPLGRILVRYSDKKLKELLERRMANGCRLSLGHIAIFAIKSAKERKEYMDRTLAESLTVGELREMVPSTSLHDYLSSVATENLSDRAIEERLHYLWSRSVGWTAFDYLYGLSQNLDDLMLTRPPSVD